MPKRANTITARKVHSRVAKHQRYIKRHTPPPRPSNLQDILDDEPEDAK
jgi:hypothetical protein